MPILPGPRESGVSRYDVLMPDDDLDLFDAYTADEAFVTSTSFCICPVVSVNGSSIGSGEIPGPVTRRLLDAYSELVGIDIIGQYLSHL